jgi:hypothetical protein
MQLTDSLTVDVDEQEDERRSPQSRAANQKQQKV